MKKVIYLCIFIVLFSFLQVTAYAASYTIIDLGPKTTPVSINNKSVIVGYKTTPDGHHTAFYWSRNTMNDLGTFSGTDSEALDVNSSGHIVGTFTQNGSKRGFKLTGSGFTDLFTTAGLVEAVGINDNGVILGTIIDPEYGKWRTALLQGGVVKDITTGSGQYLEDFKAVGLNKLGQAVFTQVMCGSWECEYSYLYNNGMTAEIWPYLAKCINNVGQVVGSQIESWIVIRGIIYKNGVMTKMNDFGGDYTYPAAINDFGQVVGRATKADDGIWHSFLYRNDVMIDLNTVLPANSGWSLSYPKADVKDINNYGQIVGLGMLNGEEHAYFLSPQYSVAGTVKAGSSTGPALAGVTVSLAGKTTTTSTSGSFSLAGILPGTYTVTISKPGYLTQTSQLTVDRDLTGLAFYLAVQPYYAIGGTVRVGSSTGSLLPGATVAIAGKTATTSSTGTFSITGIPAGTYTLTISKFGYLTRTITGFVVNSNRTGLVYYLTPAPTYYLSGTVRRGSATGPVLPGATVSIAGKTATTSSTGTFNITGIPAGTYTLTISKFGYLTRTITGYVVSGNRSGVTFYLLPAPTYSISGTVRRGSVTGALLPGATVSIAGKAATTSSTGTFTITGIPAGTYTLTISKTGYITRTVTGFVVSGNRSGLSFYLLPAPTYTISGTVRRGSATGAVLPGATVSIAGKSAITSSTGTFSISGILAGTYTLTISKTGYVTKTYTGYVISSNRTGLVFYLVASPTASTNRARQERPYAVLRSRSLNC